MKKIKMGGLLLASLLFLSSSTQASFSDTNSPTVQWVSDMGIMNGYPDGKFHPLHTITRAEISVVLTRLMEPEVRARLKAEQIKQDPFSDTPEWAAWAILSRHQEGIIQGYADGTFRGEKPITWGEFSTLVLRSFYDFEGKHYPVDQVKKMKELGITVTNPKKAMTRYEVAQVFYQLGHHDSFMVQQLEEYGYLQQLSYHALKENDATLLNLLMLYEKMERKGNLLIFTIHDIQKTKAVFPGLLMPIQVQMQFEGKKVKVKVQDVDATLGEVYYENEVDL